MVDFNVEKHFIFNTISSASDSNVKIKSYGPILGKLLELAGAAFPAVVKNSDNKLVLQYIDKKEYLKWKDQEVANIAFALEGNATKVPNDFVKNMTEKTRETLDEQMKNSKSRHVNLLESLDAHIDRQTIEKLKDDDKAAVKGYESLMQAHRARFGGEYE